MKTQELKNLSTKELKNLSQESADKLRTLRFEMAVKKLRDSSELRKLRKIIARVSTLLEQRSPETEKSLNN